MATARGHLREICQKRCPEIDGRNGNGGVFKTKTMIAVFAVCAVLEVLEVKTTMIVCGIVQG